MPQKEFYTMYLGQCEIERHDECPGTFITHAQHLVCECPCHDAQAAQSRDIVKRLKASGVRPATAADLLRFQQRIANGTVGR